MSAGFPVTTDLGVWLVLWSGTARGVLQGGLETKRVGGFFVVDTPGVMRLLHMAAEAREAVARPRTGIHGHNRPPRYRVVVHHGVIESLFP